MFLIYKSSDNDTIYDKTDTTSFETDDIFENMTNLELSDNAILNRAESVLSEEEKTSNTNSTNDTSGLLDEISIMCKTPDSLDDSFLTGEDGLIYAFVDEIVIDNFTNIHKLSLLQNTLEVMLEEARETTINHSRLIDDSRFGITPDDYFASCNEERYLSDILYEVRYRINWLSKQATKDTNSFINEQNYTKKTDSQDPEALFRLGAVLLKMANSKDERNMALAAIVHAAQKGHQPAIEFLENLEEKN